MEETSRKSQQSLVLLLLVFVLSARIVDSVTADQMRVHMDAIIPSSGVNLYYSSVRPVTNQDHSVNVTANLYLIGINSFDNSEQKLTTTAYLELQWTDEIIAQYWSNMAIETVYLPQNDVWKPDIALENGFESLSGLGDSFMYVQVEKAGTVIWKPYQVFESSCEVDVTYFPFDTTTCELKFVIWSNTIDLVRINVGSVGFSTKEYEENSDWSIQSTSAYNSDTSTNSGVTFAIKMKRKPLYYLINIFGPVIFLGILNIFVFVLPAGSGEKTGFSVTAFLSFAVFLTIISTELPQNSEKISIFSAYLFIMTMVSTLIVIITIGQLQAFNRPEDRPATGWLRSVAKFAQRAQCQFCVGNGRIPVEKTEKEQCEEEGFTWQQVSDAIDFIGFWVFLFFLVAFTTVVCAVSILASG